MSSLSHGGLSRKRPLACWRDILTSYQSMTLKDCHLNTGPGLVPWHQSSLPALHPAAKERLLAPVETPLGDIVLETMITKLPPRAVRNELHAALEALTLPMPDLDRALDRIGRVRNGQVLTTDEDSAATAVWHKFRQAHACREEANERQIGSAVEDLPEALPGTMPSAPTELSDSSVAARQRRAPDLTPALPIRDETEEEALAEVSNPKPTRRTTRSAEAEQALVAADSPLVESWFRRVHVADQLPEPERRLAWKVEFAERIAPWFGEYGFRIAAREALHALRFTNTDTESA